MLFMLFATIIYSKMQISPTKQTPVKNQDATMGTKRKNVKL